MNATDPIAHGWWLASRSAGVVAWLLLSLSLVMGLAMAMGLAPAAARGAIRRGHERVALIALLAVAAHGGLLLADPWLHPGVAGVLVPFASRYRPLWTGIGVLAAYVAAALSLSYYVRRRLGARRWRLAHRFVGVAWAMAAAHVIGAGTDAGSLWMQVPLALTLAFGIALAGQRALAAFAPRPSRRPAPAPVEEPAATTEHATVPSPLWASPRR